MKKTITPLILGNWKMNPQTIAQSINLTKALKKALSKYSHADVALLPPYVYLDAIAKVRNGSGTFALGVQDIHYEKLGPYTGSVSLTMVAQFGVKYVVVGHSERRREGETDNGIHQKMHAILKAGMTAAVCVGESARDAHGHYLSFVEAQVRSALKDIPRAKLSQVVIAYEPIWAISSGDGKGKTATPEDAHEMKLFIEKVLSDLYGRNYAQKVRILYGGSVNAKNARELFVGGEVDGFLVGGASLHADEFTQIVKATQS